MADSLTRSCFREQFQDQGPAKPRKPKGAKYKLPTGNKSLVLQHEYAPCGKGISDAGATTIRVLPASGFTFQIRRQVSERDTGDWGASLALIDILMSRHRKDFAEGSNLLELGCGMGIPGLVSAAVGANVVMADRIDPFESHHNPLEVLQENICLNFMGPSNRPPGIGTGRVGAIDFTWGEDAARELVAVHGYFDFVICADCVYQPVLGKSWVELALCLDILCGPTTTCYVSLQRRPEDAVEAFVDLLKNKYRFLHKLYTSEFSVPAGDATIELYALRRLSEVERFHIDLQAGATNLETDDLIEAWRGPLAVAADAASQQRAALITRA